MPSPQPGRGRGGQRGRGRGRGRTRYVPLITDDSPATPTYNAAGPDRQHGYRHYGLQRNNYQSSNEFPSLSAAASKPQQENEQSRKDSDLDVPRQSGQTEPNRPLEGNSRIDKDSRAVSDLLHMAQQHKTMFPPGPKWVNRNRNLSAYPRQDIQFQFLWEEVISYLPVTEMSNDERKSKEEFRLRLEGVARGVAATFLTEVTLDLDEVKLQCFGSLNNGFDMPGADLDLVVVGVPFSVKPDFMEKLKDAIAELGCKVLKLDKVRVPVIKVSSENPKVEVDINFESQLALHNTLLLKNYAKANPLVADLGRIVKLWARARKINDPRNGTLCSYAYILMVLHYLVNVEHLVPNLQLLVRRPDGVEFCEGYDVSFCPAEHVHKDVFANHPDVRVKPQPPTLEYLIRGFFRYYGDRRGFQWSQDCISLRSPGGIVSKQSKDWVGARFDDKGNRHRYLVAIEDPFEHNHNVGRTVPHNGIVAIREEFRRAHQMIGSVYHFPNRGWVWFPTPNTPSDSHTPSLGLLMTEATDRGDLHKRFQQDGQARHPRRDGKNEKQDDKAGNKDGGDGKKVEEGEGKGQKDAEKEGKTVKENNEIAERPETEMKDTDGTKEPKRTDSRSSKPKKDRKASAKKKSALASPSPDFKLDAKQVQDLLTISNGGNGCKRDSGLSSVVDSPLNLNKTENDSDKAAEMLKELTFVSGGPANDAGRSSM